jgi:Xaa-Pro aminopeptidase
VSSTLEASRTSTKIEKLQRLMESRGLDGVVVCSYQNVSYFAGTTIITQLSLPDRLAFMIARRDGGAALLVCSIETRQVKTQTDIRDVREYVEFAQEPTAELATLLREFGLSEGSIGLDARRLSAASMATLQAELPRVKIVPIDDEIELAQSVKEPDEIETLERSAQRTLAALEDGLKQVRAGCTERDVTSAIGTKLMEGGGMPAFLVFASGERTMQAHPESVATPMSRGTIWRIDFGGRFERGMYSDFARTGVVGKASNEQEATLTALRATQDAGFKAMEPGRPAKDVFFAVQDEFKRQGLPFSMPHVGHGMGIAVHEFPILQPLCDIRLEVGMVLNVEPMTLIADRREGYHVEDLAAVTEQGARTLTPLQERLLTIPG